VSNHRSADWQSAVSPVGNRQACGTLAIANRRYVFGVHPGFGVVYYHPMVLARNYTALPDAGLIVR
jgi:hypothetical protein